MYSDDATRVIDEVGSAGWRAQIVEAQRVVGIEQVLEEAGFVPWQSGSGWTWTVEYRGLLLTVDAVPEWFGPRWQLLACSRSARTVMDTERYVFEREAHGRFAATLLSFWRGAFGDAAPPPAALRAGVAWDAHCALLPRLNPGLPHLNVDAEQFRAALRWLRQRHARDPLLRLVRFDGAASRLLLSTAEELLALDAAGLWTEGCAVWLKDLLALPAAALRKRICLEHDGRRLRVNGYAVPVAASTPDDPTGGGRATA